jgi:hypothetical protein
LAQGENEMMANVDGNPETYPLTRQPMDLIESVSIYDSFVVYAFRFGIYPRRGSASVHRSRKRASTMWVLFSASPSTSGLAQVRI